MSLVIASTYSYVDMIVIDAYTKFKTGSPDAYRERALTTHCCHSLDRNPGGKADIDDSLLHELDAPGLLSSKAAKLQS